MAQTYQAQSARICLVTTLTLNFYSPPVLRHRLNAVDFCMWPSPEDLRNTEIWMLRMCIRKRIVFWLLSFNISTLFTVKYTRFSLCIHEKTYKLHETREALQLQNIYPLQFYAITVSGENAI